MEDKREGQGCVAEDKSHLAVSGRGGSETKLCCLSAELCPLKLIHYVKILDSATSESFVSSRLLSPLPTEDILTGQGEGLSHNGKGLS